MPDFGIMRGFNDKLFGDKLVAGQLPTQLGLIGSFNVYDADAQAFFDRVTAAGGTLSGTEKSAVDTLVRQMKADGTWTPMKAIYPMVGASAAACAQNLKSSSFTGTFTSGFTFASTGVTPNGTSSYMNTNYLLGSANGFNFNNFHFSHYSRTNSTSGVQVDMGAGTVGGFNNLYQAIAGSYGGTLMSKQLDVLTTNSLGFLMKTATSTTNAKLYKNGSLTLTNTATQTTTTDINLNCHIFAQNAAQFSTRQCAFASIGDDLTDTQASNLYTAVQAFQTTLSRQV